MRYYNAEACNVYLHSLAPGQHSFEEALQRCIVFNLTCLVNKLQTSHASDFLNRYANLPMKFHLSTKNLFLTWLCKQ